MHVTSRRTRCLAILLFAVGCSQEPASAPSRTLSAAELEEVLGPKAEIIGLLAAKYQLSEHQVRGVIKSYLDKHDVVHRALSGKSAAEGSGLLGTGSAAEIAITLRQLSDEFRVQDAVTAQLLFDYRLWDACGKRVDTSE